ncbi:radical SAM/SPASM domain-containing protein [Streptomyces sp. PmtG]
MDARPAAGVTSLALEITGQCQNTCAHCYARSGPHGTHGTMGREDWFAVLDQAARLGMTKVQYIGGEPTFHPYLLPLVDRALRLGMGVEVFSNLVHVRPSMWQAFERDGVALATSYYSDRAAEHEQITGGRGSYQRTRANIAEAVKRGIPLRAGIIHVHDGQRTDGARAELRRLGVTGRVRVDRVRAIGNAAFSTPCDPAQLCGRCGTDRASIGPDGTVAPCVMSRWMSAGNVRHQGLADVLSGPDWLARMAEIPRPRGKECAPASCGPADCEPADSDSCQPKGNDPCGPMSAHTPDSPLTHPAP